MMELEMCRCVLDLIIYIVREERRFVLVLNCFVFRDIIVQDWFNLLGLFSGTVGRLRCRVQIGYISFSIQSQSVTAFWADILWRWSNRLWWLQHYLSYLILNVSGLSLSSCILCVLLNLHTGRYSVWKSSRSWWWSENSFGVLILAVTWNPFSGHRSRSACLASRDITVPARNFESNMKLESGGSVPRWSLRYAYLSDGGWIFGCFPTVEAGWTRKPINVANNLSNQSCPI